MDAAPDFSVVHLTMRKSSEILSVGTGVLYEKDNRYFIATAWHNLSGRHSETLRPLSNTGGVPDNVVAVLCLAAEGGQGTVQGAFRRGFTIPIETDSHSLYLVHPKGWPRADVAVIPIDLDAPLESEIHTADGKHCVTSLPIRIKAHTEVGVSTTIQPIQACYRNYAQVTSFPERLIGAGDELFVLGYPRGITDYLGSPLWKRATVASDPAGGWNREPKFLIDCASRQGMSGAPVISYAKNGHIQTDGKLIIGSGASAALQGIYVGRISDKEVSKEDRLFEAQIGTVWKTSVIDDIIEGNTLALHSSEIGAPSKTIEAAVQSVWPKNDPTYSATVVQNDAYKWAMVRAALQELNGNADPAKVYAEVVAHANSTSQPSSFIE